MRHVGTLFSVCALLIVVVLWYATSEEDTKKYARVLERAGIVSISSLSQTDLPLVYVQTLAARDPLLNLAGNNPDILDEQIRELSDAIEQLSDMQESSVERHAAHAIAPIRFLSALSDTERARAIFIDTPTRENWRLYSASIRAAILTGKSDSRALARALSMIRPAEMRFASLGSSFSTESLSQSVLSISEKFNDIEKELRRLEKCAGGSFDDCPGLQSITLVKSLPPKDQQLSAKIARVWETASQGNAWIRVETNDSRCLSTLPAPYGYLVLTDASGEHISSLRYGDDIFLSALDSGDGPVRTYMRNVLGMSFVPVNPLKFYVCPDVREERGTIRAILATAEFARSRPELAASERDWITRGMLREYDARTYIARALAESAGPDRKHVESIIAMFNGLSGDTSDLIADITRTLRNDMRIRASGVPFETRVSSLLITHSAVPSLYLMSDLYFRENTSSTRDYTSRVVPYSVLRETVPAHQIIADLNAFLRFEGFVR